MIDNMRVGFTVKEMNERLQQAFNEGQQKGRLAELDEMFEWFGNYSEFDEGMVFEYIKMKRKLLEGKA